MSVGALVKSVISRVSPATALVRGASAHQVALTFDDGPDPQNTPRILEILARAEAVATFFLQGEMAVKHPQIVRAIHAAGHQVANHGFEHLSAKRLTSAAAVANALKCQDILQQQIGEALPRDFRPPYGDVRPANFPAFHRLGYRLVFWSFDSHDSFVSAPGPLVARMAGAALPAGSIVLLHDDYAHTVAALPEILQLCRDRSLGFARTREF